MTDEELDRARAKEAERIAEGLPTYCAAKIAARLARENWTPTPPVDRWTMEAREICSQRWPGDEGPISRGEWDTNPDITHAIILLQRGYEIGKAEADPVWVKVLAAMDDWEADECSTDDMMRRIRALIKEGGAG